MISKNLSAGTIVKINSSEKSLTDHFREKRKELGPDVLNDVRFTRLLTPFEPIWSYGLNTKVPIFNICTRNRRQIFCSTGNIGILYDYCTNQYIAILRGHQNAIVNASTDETQRWIVTADSGKENVIIIWDTTTNDSVLSLFNKPPPPAKIALVSFSPNAKLLVVCSSNEETEQIVIDFWLWTYGRDQPDDSYQCNLEKGIPKCINFHPISQENIMMVFEKSVIFLKFDYAQGTLKAAPLVLTSVPNDGSYQTGTYASKCHECFVGDTKGHIIVFGNTYSLQSMKKAFVNATMRVKTVKVLKQSITCIAANGKHLVVATVTGSIFFYNLSLEILYWIVKKISHPILSISFKTSRKYKVNSGTSLSIKKSNSMDLNKIGLECKMENYTMHKQDVPKDASLQKNWFFTASFLILTSNGMLYLVNPVRVELTPLYSSLGDSNVAGIDIHCELKLLLIAYENGRIGLYNYLTHKEIRTSYCKLAPDENLTYVKYSTQCLNLVLGTSQGAIWMLHPILLSEKYSTPLKYGSNPVMQIAFNPDCTKMAYYDNNKTVYAFVFDNQNKEWVSKGSIRSHYKDITNILFGEEYPHMLYSLGLDRVLIKYNNFYLGNKESLYIITRDRIEQVDVPLYFISYPKKKWSKGEYFLIVNDKHKYKLISESTTMCVGVYLGPSHNCFYKDPVRKIRFIPNTNKKYLVFMNKKHIGIQMMDIDGNPYKYVSCLAHHNAIGNFKIDSTGQYMFSYGKSDNSVLMWKINTDAAQKMEKLGGEDLLPFYCLLPGGKNGALLQEIRDLFYYMQIVEQGEQNSLPKLMTNTIRLVEIPDLVRACGFFPTEFEIENLLTHARYLDFDETGNMHDTISYLDFVKLFINHRPVYGYSLEEINNAFDIMTTFTNELSGAIERDEFTEVITTTGEMIGEEQFHRCLSKLLHCEITEPHKQSNFDFSFVPNYIDFPCFMNDIMGLDLDQIKQMCSKEDKDSNTNVFE